MMTWEQYYAELIATYTGGYQTKHDLDIFHHGMHTVVNCLKRRYPQGPPEVYAVEPSSALNEQVGGEHYKRFKIQPVEFTHANNIPAIEASVIWYVCRHREKNGAEDLDKAIHFLRILKELEYGKKGGA